MITWWMEVERRMGEGPKKEDSTITNILGKKSVQFENFCLLTVGYHGAGRWWNIYNGFYIKKLNSHRDKDLAVFLRVKLSCLSN